jgi:glycosyltransferase involved in cell wall biosynthesis
VTQSTKTRIVYFNHTGLISGAERVLVNMLKSVDRSRYEACVLCPSNGDLAECIRGEGVACFEVPVIDARFSRHPAVICRSIISLISAIATMRARIRQLDPDIIHANSPRAGIVVTLATAWTGRMVIWHVHDILPNRLLSTAIRLIAFLSRRTRIIGVSNATTAAFCGRLPFKQRARTIYNGIDLDKFPFKQPGSSAFRENIGIPQSAFLICALGQICERKGLLELLEAFKQICSATPMARLAIVGKPVFAHEENYRDALVKQTEISGISDRVHFTGERRDVSEVLQATDLLVLNSHHEPFGLVLVEAMASGAPVLATRVDGIPEIVTDLENGWLVERGDTHGLAARMLELSRNPNALLRIAATAHQRTCPRFSLLRFKGELLKLYAELRSVSDAQWKVRSRPVLVRNTEE